MRRTAYVDARRIPIQQRQPLEPIRLLRLLPLPKLLRHILILIKWSQTDSARLRIG